MEDVEKYLNYTMVDNSIKNEVYELHTSVSDGITLGSFIGLQNPISFS
jgi:hypothetical protein